MRGMAGSCLECLVAAVLAVASASVAAATEPFPARPVRIVLGVPPGGVADTLTRALSQELGKIWGQAVVVENRQGGSGVVATTAVGKSPPDGYTLLMANNVQFVAAALMLHHPPYDPIKDFAPVIGLVRVDDVLLASRKSSVKTVQQLIALGRAHPGRLNFGTFGPGSAPDIDAESFDAAAGIQATQIPYRGGVDVLKALITGEVDYAFTGLTAALPLIKAGRVTALAYTGKQRADVLPDVPTFAEENLKVAAGGWFGWFGPAGVPKKVIDKIAGDAATVLARPEFRTRYVVGVGLTPLGAPGTELATLLKNDIDAYAPLVKTLNRDEQ